MEYFWIILIISAASLIKGITGFGFALVSLPPLLFWYSPKEVIPVLVLCNLFVSVLIVLQKKDRKLVSRQFQSLILFGAIFTIFGVLILKHVPEHLLIIIMSILLMVLSLLTLLGLKYTVNWSAASYKITGAFLGLITGSVSISGPPLALFLHAARADNQEFREVFSWFSIVTAVIALVGYGMLGLFTFQTLKMAAFFLPILFLGSFFGKRLNHHLSPALFKKISLYVTLFSSVLLLLK